MLFIRNKGDGVEGSYIIDSTMEGQLRKIAKDELGDNGYTLDQKMIVQRNLAALNDFVEGWLNTKKMLWRLLLTAIFGTIATIFGIGVKGYL